MVKTYKDIPQPGDILATSQNDLENNMAYLANTLGQSLKAGDHQIGMNNVPPSSVHNDGVVFEGRHVQVSLNDRTGSPPTVAGIADGTNSLIYSAGGELQFSSINNNGPYQLTTTNTTSPSADYAFFGQNLTISGGPTIGGWTFLPGNLVLMYGLTITNVAGAGSVTYPITLNNNAYSMTTQYGVKILVTTTVGFGFTGGPSNGTVFWMAIGS